MAKKYSDALSQLLSSLTYDTYTAKTDDEIKQEAQQKLTSYYDQQELATRQAYETSDLALSQQLDTLDSAYAKQQESSAKEYASAYSQSDRSMLGRGMQRSSYGAQTLSNISTLAAKAQQEIMSDKQATQEQITTQRASLAKQLGDQLLQLSASESSDVLSAIDEIEAREYDRSTAAASTNNSLSAMIYEYMNAEGSSGGGSSGGGSGGGSRGAGKPIPPLKYPTYDDLIAGLAPTPVGGGQAALSDLWSGLSGSGGGNGAESDVSAAYGDAPTSGGTGSIGLPIVRKRLRPITRVPSGATD